MSRARSGASSNGSSTPSSFLSSTNGKILIGAVATAAAYGVYRFLSRSKQDSKTNATKQVKADKHAGRGGPAGVVSHHDKARENVGSTATIVATFRHLEWLGRHSQQASLVNDHYALALAGGPTHFSYPWLPGVPKCSMEELAKMIVGAADGEPGSESLHPDVFKLAYFVTLTAVRTQWIDGFIAQHCDPTSDSTRSSRTLSSASASVTAENPVRQVVSLGAGVDARAYRLPNAIIGRVNWFEVDFENMLTYKARVFKESEDSPQCASYKTIAANLVKDDWASLLKEAGFDPEQPTIWLLEGLTGYLEEPELMQLLQKIATLLPPESSKTPAFMLATFLGTNNSPSTMHKFFTDSPAKLLGGEGLGWTASSQVSMRDVARFCGRDSEILRRADGTRGKYWLVEASRGGSVDPIRASVELKSSGKLSSSGGYTLPSGWSEVFNPSMGESYFVCEASGETSWDPPQGTVANEPDDGLSVSQSRGRRSSFAVQVGTEDADVWLEMQTSKGETYYYNSDLQETTWDRPKGSNVVIKSMTKSEQSEDLD